MPLNVERIRALRPQNELHYWPSLPSTMIEATRLANSGAPHGTVVVRSKGIVEDMFGSSIRQLRLELQPGVPA